MGTMKNSEDEEVFEISNLAKSSAVIRTFMDSKFSKGSTKKGKIKQSDRKQLFDVLSKENKILVENVILMMVGKDRNRKFFGEYFTYLLSNEKIVKLKNGKISFEKMKITDVMYFVEIAILLENLFDGYDSKILDTKIRGYKNASRINDPEEDEIFLAVCRLFSIEPNVLISGCGMKENINFEILNRELEKRNISWTEVEDTFKSIVPKDKIKKIGKNEKYLLNYIVKNIDILSAILEGLEIDKTVIEEIISLEEFDLRFDDFPIELYYNKLKQNEKEIVDYMIFQLLSFSNTNSI